MQCNYCTGWAIIRSHLCFGGSFHDGWTDGGGNASKQKAMVLVKYGEVASQLCQHIQDGDAPNHTVLKSLHADFHKVKKS